MKPTRLSDNNAILGADQAGVIPISVTRWVCKTNGPTLSIGWQPSEEELERLNKGLPVIVHVRGITVQPMWVDVGIPVSETQGEETSA